MNTVKRLLIILIAVNVVFAIAGCGDTKESAAERKTLRIGATPTPHAEILNRAKAAFEDKGYTLEIVEFTDYTSINPALASGDLDANYFQHTQYLEDFTAKNKADIVSAGAVHYEPYGLYGGRKTSLQDLADGAKIAVPNDATNEARALLLLEQAGLISLRECAGILATTQDIVGNPRQLEIVELAAEQIPRALQDVDYAVINGNYAIAAGLNVATDALVIEAADGEAGRVYANVVAVSRDRQEDPAVRVLLEILRSDEITDWIRSYYQGAVLPVN